MENTIRYKCIQSVETGQPVYIRLLTMQEPTATFQVMKPLVLLPFIIALLFCATLIVFILLLPPLLFATDATYSENVYAFQTFSLTAAMLTQGYRLHTLVLALDVDVDALKSVMQHKNGYVVCSPVITRILQDAKVSGFEGTWVGMGDAGGRKTLFDRMIIADADDRLWQHAVDTANAESLYIRDAQDQYHPKHIPADLVLTKQESERDEQFSLRIQTALRDRPIMHLIAPRLGAWALALLAQSSLLWTVDSSYVQMVTPSHLNGVVAVDLGRSFTDLLETDDAEVAEVKRLFTVREMYGSLL